jgi:hypothetical protein
MQYKYINGIKAKVVRRLMANTLKVCTGWLGSILDFGYP